MAQRLPDLINLANAISDRGQGLREANSKVLSPKNQRRRSLRVSAPDTYHLMGYTGKKGREMKSEIEILIN